MRRVAVAAWMLVGCGRFGFGSDDGDAGLDATKPCTGTALVWSRTGDWRPGMTAGSTAGNPGRDARGDTVWYYEATTGGPLGASDPWYAEPATKLVWDDSWFGDAGLWALADDHGPIIDADEVTHIIRDDLAAYAPRVRWHYVLDRAAALSMSGAFEVYWIGNNATTFPTDVDLVVVQLDASGAIKRALYEMRVVKPTPDSSFEYVIATVPQTTGMLAPGDSIVLSGRGVDTSGSLDAWVTILDDIPLVATPCTP